MTDDRIVCRKLDNGGVEYLGIVDEVAKSLGLTESEEKDAMSRLGAIIENALPSFIRHAMVAAASPSVHEQSKRYFLRRQVALHDAEDLADKVIENGFKVLLGQLRTSNVGGWLDAINSNAFVDYCRKNERERNALCKLALMRASNSRENRGRVLIVFEEWVAELTSTQRAVVRLLRGGLKLHEVADALKMSIDDVDSIIQGMVGPDGESPGPKSRRRKRLS